MKASQVLNPKKAPAKERPDLEEALEESEDEAPDAVDPAADDEEGDVDLSKDKYVKQPKKRKAAAAGAKAGGSKKKKAKVEEDDDAMEVDGVGSNGSRKRSAAGKSGGKLGR